MSSLSGPRHLVPQSPLARRDEAPRPALITPGIQNADRVVRVANAGLVSIVELLSLFHTGKPPGNRAAPDSSTVSAHRPKDRSLRPAVSGASSHPDVSKCDERQKLT